jgi:hypothetical protein
MNRGQLIAALAVGAVVMGAAATARKEEDEAEGDDSPLPDPEPDPEDPEDKKAGGGYVPPTAQEWADFEQALLAAGISNFTARELTSAGGGKYIIPKGSRLVSFLKVIRHAQAIRTRYGRPLLISSGYRPWDEAGGNHELATAIDFDLPTGQKTKANERALRLATAAYWKQTPELKGLGFYHAPTGRVHIDVNAKKGRRYWYADEVEPILEALKQA